MPPSRVYLHSAPLDHLVYRAKVFHLLLKLFQFSLRDIGLQFRLNENIAYLIVFSTTSSPVAKIVVALYSGKGDVAKFDSWIFASESPKGGKLACCERRYESLKRILDLMGSILLMRVGHLESLWGSYSSGFEVLDMGKALAKLSHHDLIIFNKNFPMTSISY